MFWNYYKNSWQDQILYYDLNTNLLWVILRELIFGELGGVTFFSGIIVRLLGGEPDISEGMFPSSKSTEALVELSGDPSFTSC